jgi:hypothetical protein
VATLKNQVQNALDEARILILGTQVLIGFEYRAVFEERFDALASWARAAALASLCIMLVAYALVSLPAAYHRIAARGHDRSHVHGFTTAVLRLALLPLALGIGVDCAVAGSRALGDRAAVAFGGAVTLASLAGWYGFTYGSRGRRGGAAARPEDDMQPTEVEDRIKHVLTESRMVIPGAQALLGFQFAVTLTEAFEKLPDALRLLHLGVIGLVALSIVLLVTPAAYHRIVERGEETERFHTVASRLVVAALIPLALALAAELLVVVYKVTESYGAAGWSAGAALALFFGLWFGLPLALRARRPDPRGAEAACARSS